MIKPKDINVICLLVFLFVGFSMFSKAVLENDSLILKKRTYSFKCGANYLLEFIDYNVINDNYRDAHDNINPVIEINHKQRIDRIGLYFSFGRTRKRSQIYSTYVGFSFSNYKIPFEYTKFISETPAAPIPTSQYKRGYQYAEGNIYRNLFGLEMDFQFSIKNTKFVLSPFNPSIVFSYEKYSKREEQNYDVTVAYTPIYHNRYDSIIKPSDKEPANFGIDRPYLPGIIVLPFHIGVEQSFPFKKNVFLIGVKATFVIMSLRSTSSSAGGRFYIGYQF